MYKHRRRQPGLKKEATEPYKRRWENYRAVSSRNDRRDGKSISALFLLASVWIVTANINPLPAMVGRHPSPARTVRVIVDRTSKAEREELVAVAGVVEVVVEMVVGAPRKVIATEGTPVPATSADHRRCSHRAPTHHWAHTFPMHHHGSCTTSMHSGNARSSKTTVAPRRDRRRHHRRPHRHASPSRSSLRPMPQSPSV
jgi:hypothetical protein